jgi:(p)ppGpp synthase/HD superfamily hydrolase
MDLVSRAELFVRQAYGPAGDLAHPVEVSRLVEATGAAPELVATALLHDVLEDTTTDAARISRTFGSRIAALVETLTEDLTIRHYQQRKADLRLRACSAGPDAALIFVADKLSNARRMRRGEKAAKDRKVAHYQATLEMMRREHPTVPLLDQLERELRALGRARLVA